MSKEVITNTNDGSLVNFPNIRISSLDDEEHEEFDDEDDDDDYEDENEDEEQAPVTLGFVEKPKHQWSLLPHLFPSKAGGTPVNSYSDLCFDFAFL